jgi:hypothetical protein
LPKQIRQRHQHARLARPVHSHQQVEMRIERPEFNLLEATEVFEGQGLDEEAVASQVARPLMAS